MFKRNPQYIVHLNSESGIPPIPVFDKRFIVGRKPTHVVAIPDNSISRDHLEVIIQDGQIFIMDLGTSNGTKIDDVRITTNNPTPYQEGQKIQLGHSNVSLSIEIFSEDREKRKNNPSAKAALQPLSTKGYQTIPVESVVEAAMTASPQVVPLPTMRETPQTSPLPNTASPPVIQTIAAPAPAPSPVSLVQTVDSREDANRILAKAKIEAEMSAREIIRKKESEAQQIILQAESKALEKIREAEGQAGDLLKKAEADGQNAKSLLLEEGRAEKNRILETVNAEKDSIQREIHTLKQNIPMLVSQVDQLKMQIQKCQTEKVTAESQLSQESLRIERLQSEFKNQELQLKNILQQIELQQIKIVEAEEKHKTTIQNTQHLVEETQIALANVKKREIELEVLLEQAQKERNTAIEYAQTQRAEADSYAQSMRSESEAQSQTILSTAELKAQTLVESTRIQAKKDQEEADAYAKEVRDLADTYTRTRRQEADAHVHQITETADAYALTKRTQADIYDKDLREQANSYSKVTREETDRWAEVLREETSRWVSSTKEATELEVKRKVEQLKQETEQLLSERDRMYQDNKHRQDAVLEELRNTENLKLKNLQEIDDILKRKTDDFEVAFRNRREGLEGEYTSRRAQIDKEFHEKREKLERELSDRRTIIERELLERRESLERESAEKKALIEREAQELRAQRDREYKELKTQQDAYLMDVKKREEDRLKAMVEESRRLIKDQFASKNQNVQKSIEEFFSAYSSSAPLALRENLPQLQNELTKILKEALQNELTGEDKQLRQLFEYDPNIEKKHKAFWKRMAWASGFAIIAISYVLYNPSKISESAQTITDSVNNLDLESKKKQAALLEQIKQAGIYRPDQDSMFKDSYTDNVLYTSRYLEFEKDDQYRSQWIVAIKEYLVQEVKLLDDKADELISKEGSLIIALSAEVPTIDGRNPEKGIMRMREKESEYLQLLTLSLNDERKQTLREKKQAFYERYINDPTKLRGPAKTKE